MKKFVILSLILSIILINGCSENKYAEIDDEDGLIEKVEIFERSIAKLYLRDISLETFKENLHGICSESLQEAYFENFEFTFDKDRLAKKEAYYKKNLNHNRIAKEILYDYFKDSIDIHVSVADKITEGTFEGEKRVYVRRQDILYNNSLIVADFLEFKLYNFKNIDGKWQITEARIVDENLFGLNDAERQEIISKLPFNLYNEEGVEYIDMFSIERNE